MFRKLFIANRGEIAVRVARSAKALGIETVAAVSEADRGALHAEVADGTILIGPAEPAKSYLDVARVIEAATRCGADALHPGYGFLSESTALSAACSAAGITFVGPHAEAVRRMGSKIESRKLARELGIPVIPGVDAASDEPMSDAQLLAAAEKVGFPVMIKASAGGGGRGIRIVKQAKRFEKACTAARREAETAFGDGRLIVERAVQQPRHIEVQIAADKHGNAVHLFDRECSIQRRHQKLIEEAPAPGLGDAQRDSLREWALSLVRAIAYDSVGTIEFLLDGVTGEAYLLEMNTRLQVEHPVTEAVTGLDLVEWQLRIAAGEALPADQAALRCEGSAIEARICAEDPARGYLPQAGRIVRLEWPEVPGLRIDTGVRAGSEVTPFYDSLIAKLIVHAPERRAAAGGLARALAELRILGIQTNAGHLSDVLRLDSFLAAELSTAFLVEHEAALAREPDPAALSDEAVAATVLRALGKASGGVRFAGRRAKDEPVRIAFVGEHGLRDGDRACDVHARLGDGWVEFSLAGETRESAHFALHDNRIFLLRAGRHRALEVLPD